MKNDALTTEQQDIHCIHGKPTSGPCDQCEASHRQYLETQKPMLSLRTHGPLGPDDVIVNGPELARFTSSLSREIERLEGEIHRRWSAYVEAGYRATADVTR